jgi:poly-gamma-glutamate capsule biosynthesis protein CapA/YwtB (metallophosphatase superfamily)
MNKVIRIFLCGDVMTGRGVDQILPHASKPKLYESFIKDARDYVFLAENANGKIPYPVNENYIWGDALSIWQQFQPDIKIINLETAITCSENYWRDKEVNYRMHPKNINVLKNPAINICSLANNHVLDWGYKGLLETLKILQQSDIKTCGAGKNLNIAKQPAIHQFDFNKRVMVFSCGLPSGGIPPSWQANSNRPGLYYLPDLNRVRIKLISKEINFYQRPNDIIIFSLHWGSNWGYEIPDSFRHFAHCLIDEANVDVVFGHSSHHPRPIEIYHNKPIFYGCGDFINDYEGISGYEEYRGDLTLMYFLDFDYNTSRLVEIRLIPLQIKNLRLHYANKEDSAWIFKKINFPPYLKF